VYSHHKFGHRFEDSPPPHTSYIVCSLPRSGSSLLCDVLAGTELAGAPTEYFDGKQMEAFEREWGVTGIEEYLAALRDRKTSPNGVFGLKAHLHQLRDALGERDLDGEFPGLRLVYIRRRDHVRQGVSWARAIQTGQWASDHPAGVAQPRFDGGEIAGLIERIEREEQQWEELFEARGEEPLRFDYEELAPAPNEAVRRVFEFIGVEVPAGFEAPAPTIARQADALSEEWVRRYSAAAQSRHP
jgi:LPS sulfotransferase NodH